MSGREVGSPVAQDLVGRGVRAERPAHRDDRCCSHPNTRIGIFSVDWFQIETQFYFGNHWKENRDFHVTKCSENHPKHMTILSSKTNVQLLTSLLG